MRAIRFVLLVALVGCNRSAPPAGGGGGAPGEPAPIKVKVATPKQQALQWAIEQPGMVEAFEVTPLVAKLPGYVSAIALDPRAPKVEGKPVPLIDIGSEVEAGQLLATLDIRELDAEAAEKTAAVERARSEQAQATQDVAVAGAQIATAEAAVKEAEAGSVRADADVTRWKAELDQVNAQIMGGVADMQTRLVVTKNWESARAAKGEAEAKVATARAMVKERIARQGKAEADVAAAAAKVKFTQAEAKRIEELRAYTRITAPFAGIVTDRRINTRTFVQPTTGPLFTVARIDVLRVFAEIPEVSVAKALAGTDAVVRVPSQAGREYRAKVARTTRVVSPESRTLRIEIDIENADKLLAPGTYAMVRIDATATDAQVIPGPCVLSADEAFFVFLVEGGKAVKYRVQLGRSDAGHVQVLGRRKATATSGDWLKFTGDEKVVNGNLGALSDGTAVAVE